MKKIGHYFWIAIGIGCIGLLFYKIAKRYQTDHISKENLAHAKAVIISEQNFMGNQPVKPKFTYSYKFFVRGIRYTGDSHDTTLHVGDTVEIEYDKNSPDLNKPLHPNE